MAELAAAPGLMLCAALLAPTAVCAQQGLTLPEFPSEAELDQAMDANDTAGVPALSGLSLQFWAQRQLTRVDGHHDAGRVVLDYARTWQPAPRWTLRLSNELDLVTGRSGSGGDEEHVINTLREAWAGWRSSVGATQYYLDGGRINVRSGVGSGYNPTDFFKRDAVNRAAATLDPGALRENRMGTVMLRGQVIGNAGALTLGLAPRLERERAPDDPGSATSIALDRTNGRTSAYLKWAPQLSQRVALDVLAFGREHERGQVGLNLSLLAGDALVLNAEWTGGRRVTLPAPGLDPDPPGWRNRAVLNLVWTSPLGPELTLERHYAGDALDRAAWRLWRDQVAPQRLRQLGALARQRQLDQEPLLRDAWFARVHWRDAFGVRGFELAGFTQRNDYDGSALTQLSAARDFGGRWRAGLLLARYSGGADSEYGSTALRSRVAAYLDYRF